jgi:alpha-glucosidase
MQWVDFFPKTIEPNGSTLELIGRGEACMLIRVLEPDILRISLLPDGDWRLAHTWMMTGKDGDAPREGRRRDDLSAFSSPNIHWVTEKRKTEMHSGKLHLIVQDNPFLIQYETDLGVPLALDWKYSFARNGSGVQHEGLEFPNEHVYGLGEKSGFLNKNRRKFTMHNRDALAYNARWTDPLYKHFPFYICWRPDIQAAYGILYDNLSTSQFWINQKFGDFAGRRAYRAADGDLDMYFIYGPSIEEVVEKLTRLTGRPTLPPKYTLGYLASSMSYIEGEGAETRLDGFLENCKKFDIPCDLFHLSSGYCKSEDGKRYVFEWNRKRFHDPEKTIAKFHQQGIRVSANVKPCLLTSHPKYSEVSNKKVFVGNSKNDEPSVSAFWGGRGSFLDFTNPDAWDWWQTGATKELLKKGVDSLWNDNNEFEYPDDQAHCAGYGHSIRGGMLRPVQTLLMVQASFESQQKFRPAERPYTITRSACPGTQRYAQTWTGDNTSTWNTLRFNIPMGLGLGLSGMPSYGHDVGGFFGRQLNAELFLRWVQQGIFMPRFCIHSWRLDGGANEPWMHPAVLPQVRDAIHLRYRLMPYLYSLFREMAETGHPVQRPLVYAFPEDFSATDESFEYMLGASLLVATVVRSRVKRWKVYLPEGCRWIDFWNGKSYESGQRITIPVDLTSIPLFVPEGGMIPTGKVMQHVAAEADDLRQVHCFPPEYGQSEFRLYEDDGISLDYKRGKFSIVRISMEADKKEIIVSAQLEEKGVKLPYKKIDVLLPQNEKRRIVTEGLCQPAKS